MANTAANAAPIPAAPKRGLSIRGRLNAPYRITIYGPPGVGKTSLVTDAPGCLAVDLEDGTGHLDVERYAWREGPGGHVPTTYQQVKDAIEDISRSPEWAHVKTVVFDGLGKLEELLIDYILARDSVRGGSVNKSGKALLTIEDYGYNKGPQIALDEWHNLLSSLERLRHARGCNVILVGHAVVRNFKNPEGEDYDRWHISMDSKAAGLILQWSEVVGFFAFDEAGIKLTEDQKRAKGVTMGRRLLKTERTATYDAKTRWPIPDLLEVTADRPWAPVHAAIMEGQGQGPKDLRKKIAVELERIGDVELTKKAADHAAGTEDVSVLSRSLNNLRKRPATPVVEKD